MTPDIKKPVKTAYKNGGKLDKKFLAKDFPTYDSVTFFSMLDCCQLSFWKVWLIGIIDVWYYMPAL